MISGSPASLPSGQLSIETASDHDLAAILEVETAAFAPPERWSRASWESELVSDAMYVLVARDKGQLDAGPAGVIAMRLAGEQSELDRVLVTPPARRQGIGRRLVTAGMADAYRSGAAEMILEVRESNQAAVGLYGSLGFVPLRSRPDYYGPGSDATIMKRDLS